MDSVEIMNGLDIAVRKIIDARQRVVSNNMPVWSKLNRIVMYLEAQQSDLLRTLEGE